MVNALRKNSKVSFVGLVCILFIVCTVPQVYAHGTKTQLELNPDIFSQKTEEPQEIRKIDYLGNVLLLKPIELVKENTEEKLFRDKAMITHDEIVNEVPQQGQALFEPTTKGPKVKLSF